MSIGYQPNGSNYHDHPCNCPGCNSDGPEPIVIECDVIIHTEGRPFCNQADCPCFEALQQAWNELQAIPSYVEQQAKAWSQELDLEIES